MDFNKSLEQFKKLFQGSDTYHGQSKKLGKQRSDGKDEWRSWINPYPCLLYTSPSPRDRTRSRMPSSA